MNISQLKEKIEQLKTQGKLTNQSVEFIIENKKFFLERSQEEDGKVLLHLTRKYFKKMDYLELLEELEQYSQDKMIFLTKDGANGIDLNSVYCSTSFLELYHQKEA